MAKFDESAGGEYDPALYATVGTVQVLPGPVSAMDELHAAAYQREGFLAFEAALPPSMVDDALDGIDDLLSGSAPEFKGIQWEGGARAALASSSLEERRDWVRKLFRFTEHDARLRAVAEHAPIVEAAAFFLGTDRPALFADQALLKPPGIGREKPWHQDLAFFDLRPGAPVIGVWIALDATDTTNGCMHLLPGSHNPGPALHANVRDLQICDENVDRSAIHAVPLDPGGCLFFDGLLHHGTPQNSSGKRRWALQFHYADERDIWSSSEEREVYRASRMETFGAAGPETC